VFFPPKPSASLLALIAANAAPLAGVLLFGWDAAALVLLYWTENLIVGFYNVLRMALVRMSPPAAHASKLFLIPFFCFHYSGFCAVHGFFLIVLFKVADPNQAFPSPSLPGPLVFVELLGGVFAALWRNLPPGLLWPMAALAVSHGVSFVQNYLLGGERERFTLKRLMAQPYKRIVLLHVAILFGAMPVMLLGSPTPILALLVILKIALDVVLHLQEHKPAQAPAPASANARP